MFKSALAAALAAWRAATFSAALVVAWAALAASSSGKLRRRASADSQWRSRSSWVESSLSPRENLGQRRSCRNFPSRRRSSPVHFLRQRRFSSLSLRSKNLAPLPGSLPGHVAPRVRAGRFALQLARARGAQRQLGQLAPRQCPGATHDLWGQILSFRRSKPWQSARASMTRKAWALGEALRRHSRPKQPP